MRTGRKKVPAEGSSAPAITSSSTQSDAIHPNTFCPTTLPTTQFPLYKISKQNLA